MADPRKRTSSFSVPSPTKLQRTGPATLNMTASSSSTNPLRRTESLLSILPSDDADEPPAGSSQTQQLPYYKTLQYHKDQRLKRQAAQHDQPRSTCPSSLYSPASLTLALAPSLKPKHKAKRVPVPSSQSPSSFVTAPLTPNTYTNAPKRQRPVPSTPTNSTSTSTSPQPKPHTQIFLPSARPLILTLRTSSPLSPNPRTPLPFCSSTSSPIPLPQRTHPRSRPEPDLYRKAIRQRMGTSPEGRRVLCMGPRLAMSIMDATRELERIVAAGLVGCSSNSGSGMEGEWGDDGDVVMGDSSTTTTTTGASSMGFEYGEKSGVPPVLTNSWVLVRGDDWEMIDCAA